MHDNCKGGILGTGIDILIGWRELAAIGIDMLRKARIDAAGALHHIIIRGIERRKVFWDNEDRDSFLKRRGQFLTETQTDCVAWALIPKHAHLLLRKG